MSGYSKPLPDQDFCALRVGRLYNIVIPSGRQDIKLDIGVHICDVISRRIRIYGSACFYAGCVTTRKDTYGHVCQL